MTAVRNSFLPHLVRPVLRFPELTAFHPAAPWSITEAGTDAVSPGYLRLLHMHKRYSTEQFRENQSSFSVIPGDPAARAMLPQTEGSGENSLPKNRKICYDWDWNPIWFDKLSFEIHDNRSTENCRVISIGMEK